MTTLREVILWIITIFTLFSLGFLLATCFRIHKSILSIGERQANIEREWKESNLELEKPESLPPAPQAPQEPPAPPMKDFMDPRIEFGNQWDTNLFLTVEGCEYVKWTTFCNGAAQWTYNHKANCKRCWQRHYDMLSTVVEEKLMNITNRVNTTIIFHEVHFDNGTNFAYGTTL